MLEEVGQNGLTVSVTSVSGGKTLTFSDGTVVTILDGAQGSQGPQGMPGDDGSDSVVTITESSDGLYYVINLGGREYTVKKTQSFTLTLECTELSMAPGESKEISYTLTDADAATVVFVGASSGYTAEVDMTASKVTVKAPSVLPSDGFILITAHKGTTGEESSQYIGFDKGSNQPEAGSSVLAAANCFLISSPGTYQFNTYKGNSSESVGNVATAVLLWETYGTADAPTENSLISTVSYADGIVTFQTASTFVEGNAGIAVKDSEGKILWSWHIWLTDQPAEQVYYNNAGTVMDRNLGATSANPGDVGALGFTYQWGRKDPFPSSASIDSYVAVGATVLWQVINSDVNFGTIEYAIENPTTYIAYDANGWTGNNSDWLYMGGQDENLVDNTRWSSETKTIYDPCPDGWRVPVGGTDGLWPTASGATSGSYYSSLVDSEHKGFNLSGIFGDDTTIWYPLVGYRGTIYGNHSEVGSDCCCWTTTGVSDSYKARRLILENDGYMSPNSSFDRACGYTVRCVKE